MNLLSIILGLAAMIAFITLPVFLHHMFKKNAELKFLNHFENLAKREKLVISQKEMWKDKYLIGIDDEANKIVYINKSKDKRLEHVIDLSGIENCRVGNLNRSVKTPDGIKNVTDRLELVFTHRNSENPQTVLEFYDSEVFMTPDGELPMIENWFRIINSRLKTTKK
jgi:hypothetical protein